MKKLLFFLAILFFMASCDDECIIEQLQTQYIEFDSNCVANLPDYRNIVVIKDCDDSNVRQSPPPGVPVNNKTKVTILVQDKEKKNVIMQFDVIPQDTTPPVITEK